MVRLRAFCLLISCVLISSCNDACSRKPRDYAARSAADAVGYTEVASVSKMPGPAMVAALLPKVTVTIDGQALFVKNCSACHQMTGMGIAGAFPPLNMSPYVNSENTERMASIMLYGLAGPLHVNGMMYVSAMTPFGAVLKDEELAAIASYVRSAWGNKSAPVTPDVFAKARAKWNAHGPFAIAELGEEK